MAAGDFGEEPKLPAIPDLRTGKTEDVLRVIKEWIEVRNGTRGNGLDRALTLRDLLNAGIAEPNAVRGLFTGSVPIPILDSNDEPAIPPTPTNLTATGAIKNVLLEWQFARGYSRLSYFEVWRSLTDNLGEAVLIGQTYGAPYADEIGPGETRYYWVRAVSDGGASPYNAVEGTVGTTALDPVATMRAILEKLGYGNVDIANGVFPITTVASRPVLPNARYPIGTMVFDLSDGKLYRNVNNVWTAAVAATDVTGQLTNSQIADLAATKISGQLTDAQLADIAATKITGQLTDDQLSEVAAAKISGQLTNAQIADIAASKLTGQITSTQITDNSITTPKIFAGAVTTAKVAAGAITAGEIAANAITAEKISAGAVSAGKIAAGTIVAADIAASAITSEKIAAGSIITAKIAAGAVTAGEIAALAVTATHVSAGAIITGKIAAGAVTATEIAALAVTTAKLAAAAVDADKLAANSVIAGKIAAGAIVAGDAVISNAAIATAALQDAVITNAKIANLAVDDLKIANVSVAKLTAGKIGVGEYIESTVYTAGSTGFRIHGNGNSEFSNVIVRGTVYATAGTFAGSLSAATGTFSGSLSAATGSFAGSLSAATGTFSGTLSAATGTFAGSLSAATGTFSGTLSAATGTFAGSLSAATGTFSGTLTAAAVNAVNTLNVAGAAITGNSYATGGSDTCVAGNTVTPLFVGVTMPASSSGVVITCTISMNAGSSASATLAVTRGVTTYGAVGVSMQAGFASVFTFSAFDSAPLNGTDYYNLVVTNPNSGPGSNVTINIDSTSMVAIGAKR